MVHYQEFVILFLQTLLLGFIFESRLRYACQFWGQTENTKSRCPYLLQKCALSLLFSKGFKSSIFDLVKVLNVIFVHQHLNLPADIRNSLSFDSSINN